MINTHMPFIAESGTSKISLCCRKINNIWKLHHLVSNEWVQIETGRPADAVECSPTAEYIDGQWHISFISLGAESDRLARLYEIVGTQVRDIVSPAAVGFLRKDMKVYSAEHNKFTIEYEHNKKQIISCPEWNELLRVSYDPQRPHNLLISCRYKERLSSWLYNLHSGKIFDIDADGNVAYKCAFFNGKCYYAKQIGEDFEDREVLETADFKLIPLNSDIISVKWEL